MTGTTSTSSTSTSPPTASPRDRTNIFDRIESHFSLPLGYSSACFLLGDWNFLEIDEERFHLKANTFSRESPANINSFHNVFANFTELHQPDFTRAGAKDGALETFSRIDRAYTSLPTTTLLDASVSAGVWAPTLAAFEISDRRPVCFSIRPRPHSDSQVPASIPSWIAGHDHYPEAFERVIQSFSFAADPVVALAQLKSAFHDSAGLTMEHIRNKPAATTDEKLHWAISLARAARARSPCGIRQAAARYPHLKSYVNEVKFNTSTSDDTTSRVACELPALLPGAVRAAPPQVPFDGFLQAPVSIIADKLHEHIADLNRLSLEAKIADANVSDLPSGGGRIELLRRQAAAWRKRGKRLHLQAIRHDDGSILTDPERAVDALAAHWQPIFQRSPIDPSLNHIANSGTKTFPVDTSWDITCDDFASLISKVKDSAPGPDGIPHSCYKHTINHSSPILFKAYEHFLARGIVPSGFNYNNLICIPKGEDSPCDVDGFSARTPAQTRPITLGNTDNKIMSAAINRPLATATAEVIEDYQQGFIKGRSIANQVLMLDGMSTLTAKYNSRDSATILLDIAAAFPSLSHDAIFSNLEHRGLPGPLLRLIRALYDDVIADIRIGSATRKLIISSGIKQGCPLSATIFALVFDACISFLISRPLLSHIRVFAYADDLAVIITKIWETIQTLCRTFDLFEKIASLRLNWKKTVFVPLYNTSIDAFRDAILVAAPSAEQAAFATAAKYLGVMVGPGALEKQWIEVRPKMKTNARSLKHLAFGPIANLQWYNRVVSSLASHIGQFVEPDSSMIRTETATMAIATAGPCGALPAAVLSNLRVLGCSASYNSIMRTSVAARFRVSCTSPAFETLERLHHEADHENLDALFVPQLQDWIQRSIFISMARLRKRLLDIPSIHAIKDEHRIQSKVNRILCHRDICASDLRKTLLARAGYWLKKFHVPRQADDLWDPLPPLRRLAGMTPPGVLLTALRSIANAWPTESRIARTSGSCPFCGTGPDALSHFLGCPVVTAAREACFPRLAGQFSDPLFLLLVPLRSISQSATTRAATFSASLFLDCLFVARCAAVHGVQSEASLTQLIRGRLRQHSLAGGIFRRRMLHVVRMTDP